MGAYLEGLELKPWSERVHEIQGADPSQLPGRKLVAEACIVDLLAPMLAETNPLPEYLDLIVKAGWSGWSVAHVESSPGVQPPDDRTLSRYATDLRGLTAEVLNPLLKSLILRLFQERPDEQPDRPLNATSVKRLLSGRIPWIHRELVNQMLTELAEEGQLRGTTRGYRPAADLWQPRRPAQAPEVALAEIYQDVYPALTAYVDLQPGAVAGVGSLIAAPDRLEALGADIDKLLDAALHPFETAAQALAPERRVVLHLHRMAGAADELVRRLDGDEPHSFDPALAEEASIEARLLTPFLAMSALPGWGDPDEAWRGLKGAVALQLQRACQDLPGGFYRAAHRRHGIGAGTLASYFDGPVLISRNNGKIRAVREGEAARLESETLVLLGRIYPETRPEKWLWEQLSERAEVLSFHEYRALLLKMAREGFLLLTKAVPQRCYQSPRPYQTMPLLRMWGRWQRLWLWLPALRQVTRTLRHRVPGASSGRCRWVVDREDLPRIEVQIQRVIDESLREEIGRCAHLGEVDHLAMGGRRSHLIVFTRQEPWLLAQMEESWDENTRRSTAHG